MFERYAETFLYLGLGIVAGWVLRDLFGFAFRAWVVPILEAQKVIEGNGVTVTNAPTTEATISVVKTTSKLDAFLSRKFIAFMVYALAVLFQHPLHLTPDDLDNLFKAMLTYVGAEGSADIAGRIFSKKETTP